MTPGRENVVLKWSKFTRCARPRGRTTVRLSRYEDPMKSIITVLLLLLLTACTIRMGAFAPRRPDIPEHQNVTREDCLGCHDLSEQKDHKPTDNCLRCHHLIKGV